MGSQAACLISSSWEPSQTSYDPASSQREKNQNKKNRADLEQQQGDCRVTLVVALVAAWTKTCSSRARTLDTRLPAPRDRNSISQFLRASVPRQPSRCFKPPPQGTPSPSSPRAASAITELRPERPRPGPAPGSVLRRVPCSRPRRLNPTRSPPNAVCPGRPRGVARPVLLTWYGATGPAGPIGRKAAAPGPPTPPAGPGPLSAGPGSMPGAPWGGGAPRAAATAPPPGLSGGSGNPPAPRPDIAASRPARGLRSGLPAPDSAL